MRRGKEMQLQKLGAISVGEIENGDESRLEEKEAQENPEMTKGFVDVTHDVETRTEVTISYREGEGELQGVEDLFSGNQKPGYRGGMGPFFSVFNFRYKIFSKYCSGILQIKDLGTAYTEVLLLL
ncbi:hypothetical protein UY3_02575 [Chelonia mydas]|uniref:Uncharacterized protein n=1 Tax=Chelonia mydas TaxID=8469 RepID=M7C6M7_CHEMY|nr:hypothetical protein UY3_02575 [Chelonia mydas]